MAWCCWPFGWSSCSSSDTSKNLCYYLMWKQSIWKIQKKTTRKWNFTTVTAFPSNHVSVFSTVDISLYDSSTELESSLCSLEPRPKTRPSLLSICLWYRIYSITWAPQHFFTRSIRALILSICRSIVIRRFFFLIGTLYLYRCVTMYITTLPVPGMHMTCAPKVSNTQTSERASAVTAEPCTLCTHWDSFCGTTQEKQLLKKKRRKEAIFTIYCLKIVILKCVGVWSKTCSWQLFAGLYNAKGSKVEQFSHCFVPRNLICFRQCMKAFSYS